MVLYVCSVSNSRSRVWQNVVHLQSHDGRSILPPFMNLNTGRLSSSAQPLLYFHPLCVYGINLDTLSGSVILYLVHRIGW